MNLFNSFKSTIFLLAFVQITMCISISGAQTGPLIQWQNTIGGNLDDGLYSIKQTVDGGYILGGYSYSNISGDKTENCIGSADYWIVKTDGSGNIQWQNTIGGDTLDYFYFSTLQQTTDGGYILSGWSDSDSSGDKTENNWDTTLATYDYWIVKIDPVGNVNWQNTIGGNSDDRLYSIEQTADGGYILGGMSKSNISGDKIENNIGSYDLWIVKTDSLSNIQWQNTIGGSNDDKLFSIQQVADGGYILGGWSKSNISGDKTENSIGNYDYWIIKTDVAGNIQWQNTIGGSGDDRLYSIKQTIDGGYILGGFSESNISGDKTENNIGGANTADYWIVKTDTLGNIQWENTIGGSNSEEIYSIQQTTDGGYILGGWSESNISGDKIENSNGISDFWIVKIDDLGNILWQNTIGGSNADGLGSIQQTLDGGYILGGWSWSDSSGDKTENCIGIYDYWMVKLAPDTITGINPYPTLQNDGVLISPNPFTDELSITISSVQEKAEVKIYDVYGRIIAEKSISASDNTSDSYRIRTSDYSRGIYFVEVTTGNWKSIQKVVKQ